jgi:hypothetical protein
MMPFYLNLTAFEFMTSSRHFTALIIDPVKPVNLKIKFHLPDCILVPDKPMPSEPFLCAASSTGKRHHPPGCRHPSRSCSRSNVESKISEEKTNKVYKKLFLVS